MGALYFGDPRASLLALLFVGHVLADFLIQSESIATQKPKRPRALLQHGLLTLLTHVLCILPFWNLPALAGVLILALGHYGIDRLKAWTEVRWGRSLTAFTLDQAAHIAMILIIGTAIVSFGGSRRGWVPLPTGAIAPLTAWLVVAAGLVFNAKGGTIIVRLLLHRFPKVFPDSNGEEAGPYAMGRTIGVLERLLLYVLVLMGQWGALGLVIAAKSIARFRELDSQTFADYYLTGTLTSILVAITTGIGVRWLIR